MYFAPMVVSMLVVMVLPDPFRMGNRRIPRRTNSWVTPKFWTRGQKRKKQYQRWRTGETHMRDNPEGGELDFAEDVRRRYKTNGGTVPASLLSGRPK